MPRVTQTSQVNVRIDDSMAEWIDRHVPEGGSRAEFVRELLEAARRADEEEELLKTFDRAAEELTKEDLEEREQLVKSLSRSV